MPAPDTYIPDEIEGLPEDFPVPGIAGLISPDLSEIDSGITGINFPVPEGEGSEFWKPDDDFSMDNVGLITTGDWQGAGDLIPAGWVGEHFEGITGQNWDDEWDTLPDPYANFVVPELSQEEQTLVETADAYFVDLEARALAAGYDDPEDYLRFLSGGDQDNYAAELDRYNYFGEAWERHSEDYLTAKQSAMGAFYADPGFQAWLGSEDAQQWVNGISGTLGAVYGISGDQAKHLMTGGLNDLLADQGLMLATEEDRAAGRADYVGQVINTPDADPLVNITEGENGRTITDTFDPATGNTTRVITESDGTEFSTTVYVGDPANGQVYEPPVLPPPIAPGSGFTVFDNDGTMSDGGREILTGMFFSDGSLTSETDWGAVSHGDRTASLSEFHSTIIDDYGAYFGEFDAGATVRAYPRFIVNAMENSDQYVLDAVGGDMYSWWDSLGDDGRSSVKAAVEYYEGDEYVFNDEMFADVNVPSALSDVIRLQSGGQFDGSHRYWVPNFYIEGNDPATGNPWETNAEGLWDNQAILDSWIGLGAEGRQSAWLDNKLNGGDNRSEVLQPLLTIAASDVTTIVADDSVVPDPVVPDPVVPDPVVVDPVVPDPVVPDPVVPDPVVVDPVVVEVVEDSANSAGAESYPDGVSSIAPTPVAPGQPGANFEWGATGRGNGIGGGISDADLAAMIRDETTDLYDNIDSFDWIYYLNSNPGLGNPAQPEYGVIDTEAEAYRHYVAVGAFSGLSGFYGDPGWVDPATQAEAEAEVVTVDGDGYLEIGPGNIDDPNDPNNPDTRSYGDGTSLIAPSSDGTEWGNPSFNNTYMDGFISNSLADATIAGADPSIYKDAYRFDWIYYVNSNPDLLRAGVDSEADAWKHWVVHGAAAGRPSFYEDPSMSPMIGPGGDVVFDSEGYVLRGDGERLEDNIGPVTSVDAYLEGGDPRPEVYATAEDVANGLASDVWEDMRPKTWRLSTQEDVDNGVEGQYGEPVTQIGRAIWLPWVGADGYLTIGPFPPFRWRNQEPGYRGFKKPVPNSGVSQEVLDILDGIDLGEIIGPINVGGLAGGGMVSQGIQGLAPAGSVAGYGGGYVGGYSGGLDDSVPAVTDGQSPAALSSGEFVVPADVVAHLGDGNTQNGSAKLSDMLNRIRSYKTGSTAQPGAINDEWVFPA